ncbi:hypothetical protein LG290_09080 [Halomonas sediminis]
MSRIKNMPFSPRFVGLLLMLGLLSGCGALNRGYEALLVLEDLSAGSEESWLEQRTSEPSREKVNYAVKGRDYVADVYHPENPRRGALVLVHGFTEEGRRDPRLVEFAMTLSRVGFTLVVPELEGLKDFSISTREAQAIADAIRYTTNEVEAAGSETALAAISFAVGPALIAAMQEDTAGRVSFVVAVGGYYDLTDMLRYVTTGEDRGGAALELPPPESKARWAMLLSQLHWLGNEEDQALLESIARRKLEDRSAAVEAEVRKLGPQGRSLYNLVTNENPDNVNTLLAKLPSRLRREFKALDLSRRELDELQGQLILIHGPNDRVIPISHSRRLEDALPEGQAHLYEAAGLEHVDVSPGLLDGWELWRATVHVLKLGEQ